MKEDLVARHNSGLNTTHLGNAVLYLKDEAAFDEYVKVVQTSGKGSCAVLYTESINYVHAGSHTEMHECVHALVGGMVWMGRIKKSL